MIPTQQSLFTPFPMQVPSEHLFNSPFFPFGYPYYIPLSLFHQNQVQQIIQNEGLEAQQQKQAKILPKKAKSTKAKPKYDLKRKQIKLIKVEEQASTVDKKQLNNFIDFGEQKEGRNANSNLLRMFFRRLEFKFDFEEERLLQMWAKFSFKVSISDFITWVREAKIDYRNYVRVPTVKKLFKVNSKLKEHSKILRIMLKVFLDEESICCYLTSRKIKKESMPHNFKSIRSIYSELFQDEQIAATS